METLLVKNCTEEDIGILSFDKTRNIFIFKYVDSFKGFSFSEINSKFGRVFESDTLFSLFSYQSSYNRTKLEEKYDLKNPDSNETQWFFLKLWAKKGICVEGFSFFKL